MAGFLGTENVDLYQDKDTFLRAKYEQKRKKDQNPIENVPIIQSSEEDLKNQNYFYKTHEDGIYLDVVKKIIYSYNLQKVEQRAMREGLVNWFKPNGDLRLENDIFQDITTKPIDISLSINEKFQTRTLSAPLTLRNSTSHYKIFKLKIFINKIMILAHPVFIEEDYACAELKIAYNEYYKQINRALIPHLKLKIETMAIQLDEYNAIKYSGEAKENEKANLRMQFEDTKNKLEKEKDNINEKANFMYNKWLELKGIREKNKFASTNVTLKVMRFPVK